MPRHYSDVEVGDELGPLEKLVTSEDVQEFIGVWRGSVGSTFFTDERVARTQGLPGAIVPAPMSLACLAQLLSDWADNGQVKKLDVVFRQPVMHHWPFRAVGVVTDKNQVDGENRVECDVYLESEERGQLIAGQAILVLPDQP